MTLFLTVLHVIVCFFLVVVVLLQRGKGAEIGAVFGGGASSTVFGSRGAGNFLTKLTTGAAVIFMITSLSLSYLATTRFSKGLFDEEAAESAPSDAPQFAEPPAAPAPDAGGAAPAEAPKFAEPPAQGAPPAPTAP